MKNINLNIMRLNILNAAKQHIIMNGWNDNIFPSIAKENKFKEDEIRTLFPKGYKSLLELYLSHADIEMTEASKKIDLIRMRTNERVKQIILVRLKINEKNKDLVKRTFFTLLLPQHSRIGTLSLYNTVDQIWYIAGDNSSDFNFYTKRVILAIIYSSTIFYWVNNHSNKLEETKKFLEKQLKNVGKITKMKERLRPFFDSSPKIYSIIKNFSNFRQ